MKSFDEVVTFHGHSCPGLAMGYRVAQAALREMNRDEISGDEEVVAVVENDSCAVDAVQVMTGCTFGKGNLIFRDYGKQVYTFLKRPSGEAVRISVDFPSPEETEEEKEMWRRYSGGDRSDEVLSAVHSRKARKMKAILDAPESALLKITRMNTGLPSEARIYPSVRCAVCGEKVAEHRAGVRNGKVLCIPCSEKS